MTETQKLNFASAMDDFKNMFPHLDNTLIEQVLRRNNGMVDQTIDDLLAISCEDEDQSNSQPGPSSQILENQSNLLRPIQQQSSPMNRTYPTLSSHLPPGDLTLTPRTQQPPHQKYGQVPVTFLGVQFRIPYVDPLPHQFLRLSEPVVPANSSHLATQMAEDRDFALLLHNQEFLEQVQSNQEFMRTLNQAERAGVSNTSSTSPEVSPVTSASSSRRTEEVSISQRLSETGRVTRSKLLKIARKLNWRRSAGSSKIRQPLLEEEDEDDARLPLYEDEGGDEGLIFTDLEEAEEEFKTIPRQNTLQEFEANRQRARDTVARQLRGERPPPPPIPPPGCPSSSSTLSQDDFYSDYSPGGTLTSSTLPVAPLRPAEEPALLNLEEDDNIYEDDLDTPRGATTPIYSTTEEMQKEDNVSNLTMSETSSIYDCDVRSREIHSQTLSSSYLIPIRTFTEDDTEQYDNLNRNSRPKEDNLIKF